MTVMLLSLVCAVAVFYLRVTGPHWQLMESSVKHPDFHVYVQLMESSVKHPDFHVYVQLMESSVKHPDFHVYVQKMEASFDRWRVDSSDLLDEDDQGIFDGEFEMDSPTKVAVLKFANEHSV